jgi:S-adenosylmethionine synthetase
MQNILISKLHEVPLSFEIVERKGIGHPDTLCDAIAEQASRDYSQYCLDNFGRVAHHWFDKVMLLGGESYIDYGKGELTHPYTVVFVGKAALQVGEDRIPLQEILLSSASKVLSSILRGFDADKHLKIEIRVYDYKGPGQKSKRYRPQSKEDLIELNSPSHVSNDCNICVGFAPLSLIEDIVLNLEKEMSSGEFKKYFPDTGYDIKIIGTRQGEEIFLQVNLPFIASDIPNEHIYKTRVQESEDYIIEYIKNNYSILPRVEVNPEKHSGRPYLTVTGSVADTGDVGVVGRGNRINGLITPFRPMSIEASAGKNPLDHTGKLYSILAMQLSDELYKKTGLKNTVTLSTTKEKPVDTPDFVSVSIEDWDKHEAKYKDSVSQHISERLANIATLSEEIILKGIVQW